MPPPRPMANSKKLPTKPPVSTLVEIQPKAVLILSPSAQVTELDLVGLLVPCCQGAPSVRGFQSAGLVIKESVVQDVPPENLTSILPIALLIP